MYLKKGPVLGPESAQRVFSKRFFNFTRQFKSLNRFLFVFSTPKSCIGVKIDPICALSEQNIFFRGSWVKFKVQILGFWALDRAFIKEFWLKLAIFNQKWLIFRPDHRNRHITRANSLPGVNLVWEVVFVGQNSPRRPFLGFTEKKVEFCPILGQNWLIDS